MDTAFRKNLIFLLLIGIVFLNVAIYAGAKLTLSDSFLQLEQQAVKENLHRAANAITNDLDGLGTLNTDWSVWDDTYAFIENNNFAFIDSNLGDSTLTDLSLNAILFFNNRGQLVFGKAMDLAEEQLVEVPADLLADIQRRYEHWSFDQDITRQDGILPLSAGPMLVSYRPILTSDAAGPPRGILVMARWFNQDVIAQLAERTALSLQIRPLTGTPDTDQLRLPGSEPIINIDGLDENLIWGHSLLQDIDGRPALVLSIEMSRDVYHQGKNTISYFLLSFLLLSLLIGCLLYFLIISNRTKREEFEKRFRYAFENTTDGLIAIEPDGRINLLNPPAKILLDLKNSEFIWDSAQGITGDQSFYQLIKKGLAGQTAGPVEMTVNDRTPESARYLRAYVAPLRSSDDRQIGAIITLHDITKEKKLDMLKSEFIATAAHELNTPLTSIMGYTELLLMQNTLDEKQRKEFLSLIMEKSAALEKIIDDLFHLGKMESGREIYLEKTSFNLCSSLNQMISIYQKETVDHRIENLIVEEIIEISADRHRIDQVFDNLLSNAIKYSPSGSPIQIQAEVAVDKLTICVSDQGIGMQPQQVERAFEKFYRADNTMTAVRGLGLGLSIAKDIIEAHGGKIWIDSSPDTGAKVFFTLPR